MREIGTKFAKRSIQVPKRMRLSLMIDSVKLFVSAVSVKLRARY